jgi:hypothetical protein
LARVLEPSEPSAGCPQNPAADEVPYRIVSAKKTQNEPVAENEARERSSRPD